MPADLRASLLPLAEQRRRNARALVFVPCLHVRPGLADSTRQTLLTHVPDQLATGAYNHNGRQPRARWDPGEARRPLSRLLAFGHRLTERLAARASELCTWKVQPSGNGLEVWHTSAGQRPSLVLSASAAHMVTFASSVGPVAEDTVHEE